MTRSNTPNRFLAFDGLRGILCLLVVLSHFPGTTVIHGSTFHMTGGMFVDLFFVFSGFVIVSAFEAPLVNGYGLRRFLIERLGRFYPIHVTVLLLFVGTELAMSPLLDLYSQTGRAAFTGTNTPWAILTNLTLIHSWGVHDTLTWNYPAWSLSTEWAAYLYFVLALAFGGKRFVPWAVFGAAASAFVLIVVAPGHMTTNHDFGVFRSVLGFSVGALSFYAYRVLASRGEVSALPKWQMTLLEVVALAVVLAAQMLWGLSQWGALVLASHFVLMIVFAFGRGHLSDMLSLRPLVYLGAISLSVYVIHAWVLLRAINVASMLERLTGLDLVRMETIQGQPMTLFSLSPWLATGLACLMIALIVAISHFTYKYIEVPGQAPFRRFAGRFRAAKPPVRASA